tara:strand:- start:66 stop:257 length:192 start_codon:yes stop_codon:yes gene_type:complete
MMGRVKSDMFEDYLGPDDELVAKPISQVVDNIRDCDLPLNSLERFQYMQTQMKELMNGIKTNS